jgi:hypothetical protein
MRYDNFSISMPPGYADSLEEEAKRYGFNRSEFLRVLFDAYLVVASGMIQEGKREEAKRFFYDAVPHRRQEAEEWLDGYLRLVLRIAKEAAERKANGGSLDEANSVYDRLPVDKKSDAGNVEAS